MINEYSDLFKDFKPVHDAYIINPKANQNRFNDIGQQVLKKIREWEQKLCRQTEGGTYSRYSGNLSEKFWIEIRKEFPKIDSVGVKLK